MVTAKSNRGTILNLRVSFLAKQKLLEKSKEISTKEMNGAKVSLSDMIKVAIKEIWGVDCDEYE